MNISWSNELLSVLERAFGEPRGSDPFLIICGIAVASLFLFGWCVVTFICSARKGLFLSAFAQSLPAFVAVLSWIALARIVAPMMETQAMGNLVSIGGAFLAGLLTSLILTRRLLGISASASVVSTALTYVCVIGAVLLGGSLVRETHSSLHELADKKNQREIETHRVIGQ